MFVLVEDAAEPVASVDAQVGEPVRIGDRFGQRGQWPGVRDALMRPVGGVENLELAQHVRQVPLLVRRQSVTETMSDYLTRRVLHHDRILVHTGAQLLAAEGDHSLRRMVWHDAKAGRDVRVDASGLFVMIGAVPHTGWLADAGVELDDAGFVTTADGFATSVPGVFAVGDVRSGSIKRVASAVGEGAMVISAVHSHLADTRAT